MNATYDIVNSMLQYVQMYNKYKTPAQLWWPQLHILYVCEGILLAMEYYILGNKPNVASFEIQFI